ncbi:MAG: hypothetical protein MZV70_12435 [Desulfobacterales bacterium]|nr:hypothetical protein [Desulfobacterales bacterium]
MGFFMALQLRSPSSLQTLPLLFRDVLRYLHEQSPRALIKKSVTEKNTPKGLSTQSREERKEEKDYGSVSVSVSERFYFSPPGSSRTVIIP